MRCSGTFRGQHATDTAWGGRPQVRAGDLPHKTGMTVGKPVCGHQGHKGQPNLQSSLCISASPELCPAACTTCSAKQGNNPAVKHPDNMGLMSIHLLQGLCQQC